MDENEITYNSFYDVGIDSDDRSEAEEDLMDYKMLVGFPVTSSYDQLMANLEVIKKNRTEQHEDSNVKCAVIKKHR